MTIYMPQSPLWTAVQQGLNKLLDQNEYKQAVEALSQMEEERKKSEDTARMDSGIKSFLQNQDELQRLKTANESLDPSSEQYKTNSSSADRIRQWAGNNGLNLGTADMSAADQEKLFQTQGKQQLGRLASSLGINTSSPGYSQLMSPDTDTRAAASGLGDMVKGVVAQYSDLNDPTKYGIAAQRKLASLNISPEVMKRLQPIVDLYTKDAMIRKANDLTGNVLSGLPEDRVKAAVQMNFATGGNMGTDLLKNTTPKHSATMLDTGGRTEVLDVATPSALGTGGTQVNPVFSENKTLPPGTKAQLEQNDRHFAQGHDLASRNADRADAAQRRQESLQERQLIENTIRNHGSMIDRNLQEMKNYANTIIAQNKIDEYSDTGRQKVNDILANDPYYQGLVKENQNRKSIVDSLNNTLASHSNWYPQAQATGQQGSFSKLKAKYGAEEVNRLIQKYGADRVAAFENSIP